ncbi:uncharacterized protein [Triticum aestivum]|uniref:uncharacterized protein isoform X2 n=1 Tax=Triticum aestivum TaxID=4565 RepID=UPI001D032009|nr:uncharacterized protein LOC123045190 isoform X2 [Triticum aestivum]
MASSTFSPDSPPIDGPERAEQTGAACGLGARSGTWLPPRAPPPLLDCCAAARRPLSTPALSCATRDSASLPSTGHDKQGRKWFYSMVHFKNRYMVMEVFIDASRGEADPVILTQFNITKVIRDSIQLNFGECGLAASLGSLQVKYVNPVTKLCVIRVSREDHQKVWAAITMVKSIGKIPVSFNLLDVSGRLWQFRADHQSTPIQEVSGPARKPRWSAKKRSLSSTSWLLVTV